MALGPDQLSTNYSTFSPTNYYSTALSEGLRDSSTAGVTINGASDNAHVVLNLSGAAAGNTDTITLGNGNNYISDESTAGTVNVTVGTGANYITLGPINAQDGTAQYNVTLGTHTPTSTLFDVICVGAVPASTAATVTAPNLIVTGAAGSSTAGDVISFLNDTSNAITVNRDTNTAIANANSSSVVLQNLANDAATAGAHTVEYAVYLNNTYIVEALSGTAAAYNWTAVELVGNHTIAADQAYHGVIVTA